ncbi:MAG: beta/gamma crystallin-related protein [Nostoc sp.]|uniref:beta/gamma crystallin-related protein n=1 Tax=Nostoc sp. TaxID=1180 RepID=UPI002FF55888
MSNINKHGVIMNNIELSPHLQQLTCEQAAAIQGGAKIQLFLGANFTGKSLLLTINKAGLSKKLTGQFNNSISSAKVLSGIWDLRTNGNGEGGLGITLRPGKYPRFTKAINNTISFVKATLA